MTTTEARRRGAALVALLLALAGCGSDPAGPEGGGGNAGSPGPAEPADVRPDVPRPDVTADLQVDPGADAVAVRYSVTNDGAAPLLLANRLPHVVGAGTSYDSTLAYVTGAGADGVEISQRVFPWPDGDVERVAAPQVGASVLEAGATVTVALEVPLPLVRSQPFGDDLGEGTIELPDPVAQVSFCLGVLPRTAGAAPDEDGVVLVAHGDAALTQYLLCSDPVALG